MTIFFNYCRFSILQNYEKLSEGVGVVGGGGFECGIGVGVWVGVGDWGWGLVRGSCLLQNPAGDQQDGL